MSSDQNSTVEDAEGSNVKSESEKESPSPRKKSSEEHAKGRRRKRGGQKRKQRKGCAAQVVAETHEEPCAGPSVSPDWNSDEELDGEINAYNDIIIRPVNVPKAPENSTQYIIDDHNECRLYMSFETPNPYVADRAFGCIASLPADENIEEDSNMSVMDPIGEDQAYIDIDWEYESPADFDNSAYYDREFELSYKNNRFDELLRLPRTELISGLHNLESRLQELSDVLVKEDPSCILEKLQAELLDLQEKHLVLKDCNTKLTALLLQPDDSSVVVDSTEKNPELRRDSSVEESLNPLEAVMEQQILNSEAEVSQSAGSHMEVEPCQSPVIHSCSEEQVSLQPLVYHHDNSDELPHSSVSDEHELSVLAV